MLARMTKRTELRRSRELPTARNPRRLAKLAKVTPLPDTVWDRDFRLGSASCVVMIQSPDHREGDDLPSIDGLTLAGSGDVLVGPNVAEQAIALGIPGVNTSTWNYAGGIGDDGQAQPDCGAK